MTWTKLDAGLPDNPSLLRLPRGIRWMHVEAMVWCNKHGTDGDIPRHALARVTDEPEAIEAADQLVKAGLWISTDTGWAIVGFLDDQPSAADVERTQALARERQRKQRQHRNGDHSLCDPRYCQQASRVTNGVSNGVSHDTRTDRPDRTEGTKGREDGRGAGARSASATRAAPSREWPHYGPPPGVVPTLHVTEH